MHIKRIAALTSIFLAISPVFATDTICTKKNLRIALEPNVISSFVVKSATAAYSYNCKNMKQKLQQASQYFAKPAWNTFLKNLKQSGMSQKIIKHKLSLQSSTWQSPTIRPRGNINCRYTWTTHFPLILQFSSHNQNKKELIYVKMTIVRSDAPNAKQGILIQDFSSQPAPKTHQNMGTNIRRE